MTRRFLFLFVALFLANVTHLPATAQSTDDCVAYLEADAAFNKQFNKSYKGTVAKLTTPVKDAEKRVLSSRSKLFEARNNVILVLSRIYARADENYRRSLESAIRGHGGFLVKEPLSVATHGDIRRILIRKDLNDFNEAVDANIEARSRYDSAVDSYNKAIYQYWMGAANTIALSGNSNALKLANDRYSRVFSSRYKGPTSNNEAVMAKIFREYVKHCRERYE